MNKKVMKLIVFVLVLLAFIFLNGCQKTGQPYLRSVMPRASEAPKVLTAPAASEEPVVVAPPAAPKREPPEAPKPCDPRRELCTRDGKKWVPPPAPSASPSPTPECISDANCKGKSTFVFCRWDQVWGDKAICVYPKCKGGMIENCNGQNKHCYKQSSDIDAQCVECRDDNDCKGKSTVMYCQGNQVFGDKIKCSIEHKCVEGTIDCQNKFCYEKTGITLAQCVNCIDDNDCQPSYKCSWFRGSILKSDCYKGYYNWLNDLVMLPPGDWECEYSTYRTCRPGTKCVQEGSSARCVIREGEDCEDSIECPQYGNEYCKSNAIYATDCISGKCNRLGIKLKECPAGQTCVERPFNGKIIADCVPNERLA